LLVLAALLMAIVSTVAIGSNMGFKISIPLTAGVQKCVSVPYYCTLDSVAIDGGSALAQHLRNEITAAGGTSVSVYNWNGSVWQRYSGGTIGQVNFPLVPGTGYLVVSATPIAGWVVVGSHNPSLSISLTGGVQKLVSVPYHTTGTLAADLRNEIMGAGGTSVSVYNWNGSVWQRYSGGTIGQVNFPLTPGSSYLVVSAANVPSWTPAHY
jgi:hypothetical protein